MQSIGDRVREIRRENGLTQKEFGESLSLKTSTICLLENGGIRRSDRTLNAICKEYSIRKDWLLTGEGEKYANQPQLVKTLENELKRTPSLFETAQIASTHMGKDEWENANRLLLEIGG